VFDHYFLNCFSITKIADRQSTSFHSCHVFSSSQLIYSSIANLYSVILLFNFQSINSTHYSTACLNHSISISKFLSMFFFVFEFSAAFAESVGFHLLHFSLLQINCSNLIKKYHYLIKRISYWKEHEKIDYLVKVKI
jgi:hypothetical protein